MYGFDARYHKGKGMIERDKLIIRERELKRVSKMVGRNMALATGRPFLAVKYTLGNLIEYFDPGASVFMGDANVHPQIAHDFEKYHKPSGYSLIRAMQLFASDMLLYVGDSEEDRMMVKNAKSSGGEAFLFAGIYGTAADEDEQVKYLKSREADIILRSVNELSSLLEMKRD
jgi:phosphoglycolate phosphatase-like HAD superfamily hydrolase